MFLCLACKQQASKRVSGECPNCGERVKTYTTVDGTKLWVPLGDDAPPTQLMKFWMQELSKRMSADAGHRVLFDIHPMRQANRYKAEIALAGQLLYQADWDIDLAKESLRRAIDETYKAPVTLKWIGDSFNAQMHIVLGEQQQVKQETSEDITKQYLDGLEDVWA